MKPLGDVRIIALEQYGAGPFGSVHLADLGAEVIKIEEPRSGGDVGRYVPPFQSGEDSLFFEAFNRNKSSLSLDMRLETSRAVFNDLVKVSDVVYSNLRGDVPGKIGITYKDLAPLNPRIVCCSLSGFGMTGPRSSEPGYDYIMQGMAGWMDITGEPDGPPTKSGLSIVDYSGGLVAAIAILAGLHAARRDGVGMDCDISLFDTAIAMLTYPAIWQLNGDFEPRRTHHSAHPSLVPFQVFAVQNGWVVIACPKEKFWRRLADAVGRPDLSTDVNFATFATRSEHSVELLAILDSIFLSDTVDNWLKKLAEHGVPSGPVNSVEAALRDPHTLARSLIVETDHPYFGRVKQVRSPVNVGTLKQQYVRAPRRNEHMIPILSDLLGYSSAKIDSLVDSGAFGAGDPEG